MASFGKKEPIHWCKANVGKKNPMKFKRKAIGPAGQVVEMSLATGKTIVSRLGNPYAELKTLEKEGRDWVWYDECEDCEPVPAMELQKSKAMNALCETCGKREALISARQKAKGLSNKDYSKLFETRLDKLAEVIERGMVGNQRPTVGMDDLAEVMTAAPPAKKTRRKAAPSES